MRNKSKNRIKHEMRIKMHRLEEDNRLLLRECRHIREMREMYYEKWVNNCPKYVFNPSNIVPICSRITIPKDDFDIINGKKDSACWLKERLLNDALKSVIVNNLFTIEYSNNVYEATIFLAVPTAMPSEKYRAHIYGEFDKIPTKLSDTTSIPVYKGTWLRDAAPLDVEEGDCAGDSANYAFEKFKGETK